MRKGATHLKVMASGGVSSPTDRLTNIQFSDAEIRAIVEEASFAGLPVAAHAYTPPAIKRAIQLGCTSIEHGNYADEECLDLMKEEGVYLVPTLITYDRILKDGAKDGMPQALVDKVGDLVEAGLEALKLAHQKGVSIAYGSDLLGRSHQHQAEGLALHATVQSNDALLASLTEVPSRLLRMEDRIGKTQVGAYADLIVVEEDTVFDAASLRYPSAMKVIVKDGLLFKLTDDFRGEVTGLRNR